MADEEIIIIEEDIPVESTGLDDSIGADLEEHLDSLPEEAKNFMFEKLAGPSGADIVTILGLVLGPEALQFFANTKGVVDQNPLPPEGLQPEGGQPDGFIGNPQQPSGPAFV